MKKYTSLSSILFLIACGSGDDGSSCSVKDISGGSKIVCSDGTSSVVTDGENGADGLSGSNGATGPAGTEGTDGVSGSDGDDGGVTVGPRGPAGADGRDGIDALNVANIVGGIALSNDAFVIVESMFCNNPECSDVVQFSTGSGTKTGDGKVITAMHVVDHDTLLWAGSDIYAPTTGAFLGHSELYDQSGLRDQVTATIVWNANGNAIEGLTPSLNNLPELGEFVVVVGHPGVYTALSMETQYTSGFVTSADVSVTLSSNVFNAGVFWADGYTVDAVAWHGNSGGAVFNEDGEWIGLLVGAYNGGPENEGPDLCVVIPVL